MKAETRQVLGIEVNRNETTKRLMECWRRKHGGLELWCGRSTLILFAVTTDAEKVLTDINLPSATYSRKMMPEPHFK